MTTQPLRVYQFKITLAGISPPIWRRFRVPEAYSFWDLHVAIQDAMGWLDSHLHEFEIDDTEKEVTVAIGIPDEDSDSDLVPGWEAPISEHLTLKHCKAKYTYDFGDDWVHRVVLEKVLPAKPGTRYPVCVDGRRACPPEDCGGPWGYQRFLASLSDPEHPENDELLEWVGGSFDAEAFNPAEVRFDDPRERWKIAFEEHWL